MVEKRLVGETKVELVTPDRYCDDFITDTARVSFDRRSSEFSDEDNAKLRRYLFNPRGGPVHWAPFATNRLNILINLRRFPILDFLYTQNTAGFTWADGESPNTCHLNGSLWAWYEVLDFFLEEVHYDDLLQLCLLLKSYFPDFFSFAVYPKLKNYSESCPKRLDVLKQLEEMAEVVDMVEPQHPNVIYETFRISCPIFIARQLGKHQVNLVWNEVSRRYVKDVPELFFPNRFHQPPEKNIKQGSSDIPFDDKETLSRLKQLSYVSLDTYESLVTGDTFTGIKMAPEEARMFLPQSMMTSWFWTGPITAWNRVLKERLWKGAQKTVRLDFAPKLRDILQDKYGNSVFKGY